MRFISSARRSGVKERESIASMELGEMCSRFASAWLRTARAVVRKMCAISSFKSRYMRRRMSANLLWFRLRLNSSTSMITFRVELPFKDSHLDSPSYFSLNTRKSTFCVKV